MQWFKRTRSGLEHLKNLDPQLRSHGADSHQYRLKKCLTERVLQDFENKYTITLPDQYRWFLKYMGNGGAGPYYGIHSLADTRKHTGTDLAKPFLHREKYVEPPYMDDDFDDEIYVPVSNPFQEPYVAGGEPQGSLWICDEGCGRGFRLVITGDGRGEIWYDQLTDGGGMQALKRTGSNTPILFFEWYERWLESSIEKLALSAPQSSEPKGP
jgi:hypothetical protein